MFISTVTTFLIACSPSWKSPSSTIEERIERESAIQILYSHRNQESTSDTTESFYQELSLGTDWANQPLGERNDFNGWGVAVQDFNNDGYWDIFLPQFGLKDQLFFGQADFTVEDVSTYLPEYSGLSYGATAADLDHDGDIDILVSAENGNILYQNEFPRAEFTLHIEEDWLINTPSSKRTHHLAIADADQDGFYDLFGPTFYSRYDPNNYDSLSNPPQNVLYWGAGNEWVRQDRWSDSLEYSPANAGGWVDLNDDGLLELFIVNDKPSGGYLSGFLRNNGARDLEEASNTGLEFSLQGMGLAWGDINQDGLIDIAVSGWDNFGLGISDGVGQWYEASEALGLHSDYLHRVGWGLEFVDLDLDGVQDILVANGPDYDEFGNLGGGPYLENAEELFFAVYLNQNLQLNFQENTEWTIGEGGSFRGFAMVDWNRDGFLDIIARDLGRSATYYQSRLSEDLDENHSLIIELHSPSKNAQNIGARIWVTDALGNRQFRDITAGSTNIASCSPPIAHFGLGSATLVDIDIRWADGFEEQITGVETGNTIRISRPF